MNNDQVFRGRERDYCEVWSLLDFMFCFKLPFRIPFVTILLTTSYLVVTPSFSWVVCFAGIFYMHLYTFLLSH